MGEPEAVELTEDQRKAYREAFDAFDTDKGGSVDKGEIKAIMNQLGQHPSDEELAVIMKDYDADGSGDIDFEEFCAMMHRQMQSSGKEELIAETFKWFDSDNAGYIDNAKLKKVMEDAGGDLTLERAQEMIDQVDTDGDGKLNMDEFKRLYEALAADAKAKA